MAEKQNLFDILKETLNDHMTKSDFLAATKEFKKSLDENHTASKTELVNAAKQIAEGFAQLKNDLTTSTTDTTSKSAASLEAKFAGIQSQILARLAELKNGDDGVSPSAADVVPLVLAQLNLPEQRAVVLDGPEEIRNKLETFVEAPEEDKLDPRVLKGFDKLEKKVTEIGARPSSPGGGGLSQLALKMALSKIIRHEKFTTSSASTTVTLANKVAGNVCLWLRYNGAMLRYGTDYTLSGKIVTFVGFTLDDSSSVEVTYFTD